MTPSLSTRIIHAYLSNLRTEYIARVEKIPVAEVERVVAKALSVPTGRIRV